MKVVLAGGTGFIGKALLHRLIEEGHRVVLLTRSPSAHKELATDKVQLAKWDAKSVGAWADFAEGAEAVLNLAGEPLVGKRWTKKQKARLLESRLSATRAITSAIAQAGKRPSVFINASAVGFYGDVPQGEVTESHPKGRGFLGDVCERWEVEARRAEERGVRVVCLRIGIVLEKEGGALSRMIPPFQYFIGGPLGSGRQWVPWIHREDLLSIILFLMARPDINGAVNGTAPNPATMKEFCKAVGSALHRPSWAPVPAFALRVLLGEMAEVLLTGARVVPQKLEEAGFPFRYPALDGALTAILSSPNPGTSKGTC